MIKHRYINSAILDMKRHVICNYCTSPSLLAGGFTRLHEFLLCFDQCSFETLRFKTVSRQVGHFITLAYITLTFSLTGLIQLLINSSLIKARLSWTENNI